MRSFAALTDHDFELLVADLFSTAESARYEVFARGPDLGVDLRYEAEQDVWHVVQCKNYVRSTVSDLRTAARKEAKKLGKLSARPASYRFVTSRRLTRDNKRSLKNDLAPFIRRQADVWGEDDLELLLGKHPEVERRHIKLWMPSSTQLQSLIAASTYSRSKVLAEEVFQLLPRWVPGMAFFRARALLRDEGVCVIAGVPGIGKTTLAKMLLADAIHDGFEAVSVSSDIDEAWQVYDPAKRQAFYYDDFLGRTALTQRLGKNEEDRLITFMRRAAGNQTTLFILTTREYVLQQAHQLYEQLAIEGVEGKRFLLQLENYSRLDRARMFYNHAFFSRQLSSGARQALLTDRAYEAIVDHKAYNPRQIEWITGLSGHQLTADDNADYVRFAVSALDDPALIWRHGFEQQLDRTQRALLTALASMPDRVERADLERAFEAYCGEASVGTGSRAFTRALKVLDDSFVRTYHDSGRIFVAVYDPSVDDFLSDYLAASPTDARVAVRGAVFFEQVEKLGRLLRAPEIPQDSLASDFVDAVGRCFASSSCTWEGVFLGPDAVTPTTMRKRASLEGRLDFIGRMTGWGGAYGREPLRARLQMKYADGANLVSESWEEGQGDDDDALYLLQAMRARGERTDEHDVAAKQLITSGLHYPDAFRRLLKLRDLAPTLFGEDEWDELRHSYLVVAERELADWSEISALDEIDDIEHYAERMGVDLDWHEVEETRERVASQLAEAQEAAAEQAEDRELEEEPEQATNEDEIEVLFTRLADD